MKTLFIRSAICAICSMIAFLVLSFIDVVPTAQHLLAQIGIVLSISAVFWIALAIWAGFKLRDSKSHPLSKWLTAALILISVAYILVMLFSLVA